MLPSRAHPPSREGIRVPILLALASYVFNIVCIVHAIRTGRAHYWLLILIMVPGIGSAAYFFMEWLPEIQNSRGGQSVARQVTRTLDPDRDYRQIVAEFEVAPTIDNKRALADELVGRGKAEEAVRLYRSTLVGVYKDDPVLMMGLARAQFAANDPAGTTATLDALRAANPEFQSADGHLLYARALEGQERDADARREYEALAGYYPGAEARCRYALLLERVGETDAARRMFAEVVKGLDRAGRIYIREQREWYDLARSRSG